jgi:adenosyl cobinamide kinase/adenosyl cobinamide phosphate guanylyltransferase
VITLVLGGARSGKSAVAEAIAARLPQPVTYLATARVDPTDEEWVARVEAHRRRRDRAWATVEVRDGQLARVLREVAGSVLLDSIGTWVSAADGFSVDVAAVATALGERDGDTVLVSEEVGLGVHPSTEEGRRFRDALGDVNRAIADRADEVLLVVAGRVLPLERP